MPMMCTPRWDPDAIFLFERIAARSGTISGIAVGVGNKELLTVHHFVFRISALQISPLQHFSEESKLRSF
jgi:hypothetical protein